jgi:pilus assembly protein Flp/PilA
LSKLDKCDILGWERIRPYRLTGKLRKGGERMLFIPGEEGQGLTEYGMIIVLVAIVVVIVLALLGPRVAEWFSSVVNAI